MSSIRVRIRSQTHTPIEKRGDKALHVFHSCSKLSPDFQPIRARNFPNPQATTKIPINNSPHTPNSASPLIYQCMIATPTQISAISGYFSYPTTQFRHAWISYLSNCVMPPFSLVPPSDVPASYPGMMTTATSLAVGHAVPNFQLSPGLRMFLGKKSRLS